MLGVRLLQGSSEVSRRFLETDGQAAERHVPSRRNDHVARSSRTRTDDSVKVPRWLHHEHRNFLSIRVGMIVFSLDALARLEGPRMIL
jgi:hypothetical protein